MPKKKEKGVRKSEEDRLLRAQAEQEMKQRKEETLAEFLKNKVQAEQKNSIINRQKLTDNWREILRQCKTEELRTEMVELQQGSERQLDELDSVVERLVQEVHESERKAMELQCAHQQHMEQLFGQRNVQLLKLQKVWLDFLRDRSSVLTSERKHVQDETLRLQGKLEDLKLSAEERDKDELDELCRLNKEMLETYASAEEDCFWLCDMDEVQKDLTVERGQKNTYLEEKEKFDKTMERLEQQKLLLQKVQQTKLERSLTSRQNELTASISELKQKIHQLQVQIIQNHNSAKKQLIKICVQGNQVCKCLQAVIDKEEKIISISEMCKKMERKHESLLASVSLPPSSEEHQQLESTLALDPTQLEKLQPLILRVSTAQLLVKKLKKEKQSLYRENENMQLRLHQYNQHNTLDGHCSSFVASRAPTTSDQKTGQKDPSGAK